MRTLLQSFAALLLAGGCTTTAVLGPIVGEEADTDTDTDTDTDAEPDPDWMGDWGGAFSLDSDYWPLCEGEVEVSIDREGDLTGTGGCEVQMGWDTAPLELVFDGYVEENGDVTGTVEHNADLEMGDIQSGELTGEASATSLDLQWTTVLGEGDWAMDLIGQIEATPR